MVRVWLVNWGASGPGWVNDPGESSGDQWHSASSPVWVRNSQASGLRWVNDMIYGTILRCDLSKLYITLPQNACSSNTYKHTIFIHPDTMKGSPCCIPCPIPIIFSRRPEKIFQVGTIVNCMISLKRTRSYVHRCGILLVPIPRQRFHSTQYQ